MTVARRIAFQHETKVVYSSPIRRAAARVALGGIVDVAP